MVRPIPIFLHGSESSFSTLIPVALGLFVSVSILVGMCAKHARQRKSSNSNPNSKAAALVLPSPAKKLMETIRSHKAMTPLIHGKKSALRPEADAGADEESGVWQKAIMMGEKCQPPEFSGVIYYDYDGNRIPEMPKSPRHTSMTPLKTFSMPVHNNHNSPY